MPKLDLERFEYAFANSDDLTLKSNERRHILFALNKASWKVRGSGGAAEILDIHPSTLQFRMKKLGIKRPKK